MLTLSQRQRPTQSSTASAPTSPLMQMVDRRLSISQMGLDEVRRHLAAGQIEDADTVLQKIDEDLHLLRRRLICETEARRPNVLYGGRAVAGEEN